MTRLLITTGHRSVGSEECSGYIYVFDTKTSRFLREVRGIEPPFREKDNNPRGGARGMRGISFRGGELAIGNYSCIFCFDRHWVLQRVISNPVCAGVHDILLEGDGIWITSTANDLLLKLDFDGNIVSHISLRGQRALIRTLKIDPGDMPSTVLDGKIDFRDRSNFNTETYDHLHVNSFAWVSQGDLIISLGWIVGKRLGLLLILKAWLIHNNLWDQFIEINRKIRRAFGLQKQMLTELVARPARGKSALLRVSPRGEWSILLALEEVYVPSHGILILKDGTAIYLYTTRGEVVHLDSITGKIFSRTQVTEDFLRGAVELEHDILALGAGTELILFDLRERRVVKRFYASSREQEAIFSIQILPDDFDLPPANLAERVGKIVGFEGRQTVRKDADRRLMGYN